MSSKILSDQLAGLRDVLNNEEFANKAFLPEPNDSFQPAPIPNNPREIRVLSEEKSTTMARTEAERETTPSLLSRSTNMSSTSEREYSIDNDGVEEIGSLLQIKHLYANEKDEKHGSVTYRDRLPLGGVDYALRKGQNVADGIEKFAIVHYHELRNGDLSTYKIDIWNSEVKKHISDVLSGYRSIDAEVPKIDLRPPFVEFLHRWDRLSQMSKTLTNTREKQLLCDLKDVLATELDENFKASDEYERTGYIDFPNILIPFVPGEVLLQYEDGVPLAAMLQEASIVTDSFTKEKRCQLRVQNLHWDGTKLGFDEERWYLSEFEGYSKVTDLRILPLSAHRDQEEIRRALVERGRRFEKLCGQYIQSYTGHVYEEGGRYFDSRKTITLSERIIIDAKAYYKFQYLSVPTLKGVEIGPLGNLPTIHEHTFDSPEATQQQSYLTDEQCVLASPKVKGFALSRKAWYKFNLDDIRPVKWNNHLLANLVIQEQEKEMLLALVSHAAEKRVGKFDDFMEGKGKGLIILLAGPPGVGKTLTVESIAEELKRPLYRVGAGDLGTRASAVESSLKDAFDRCSHWSAVLLIDEADIFLERRSTDGLERNELVSIFLTMIEYYQGILILTTNRTHGIDPAFESRIDIILNYDNLSQDSRRRIWANFIETLQPDSVDLSPNDFDSLSQWVINGRQIKSAVKTAVVLANKQQSPLGLRHLEIVLNVRKRGAKLIDSHEGQWEITGQVPSSRFKWPWSRK